MERLRILKSVKNFLLSNITIVILLLIAGILYSCDPQTEPAQNMADTSNRPLYLNHNEPIEDRIQDLISRLTLKEKTIVLTHDGPEIKRLNITSDGWNQNMHGVWWDRPTTLFPVPAAMAATWDTTLVKDVSSAIADESRAIYNWWKTDSEFWGEKRGLIYRQPVINMGRNPYWGRNYEIWGEDPHLAGRMSVAYINGFRGNDPKYLKLAPTAKHFAVNNVEEERRQLSASVDERWLHEYWLPAFKDAIMEGGVEQVMASYNAINGIPNVMNKHLLTDILKERWGYEGFVVDDLGGIEDLIDDWGTNYSYEINYDRINHWENFEVDDSMTPVEAVANAMNAGVDFDDEEFMQHLPQAVRQGLVSEERLNDALTRVLRTRFKVGDFDPHEMVPYSNISPDVIGSKKHRQLALETAQKSMVLLKNQNNFLPLDKDELDTIAVIGPHANRFTPGGYVGEYKNPVTPLQGIKNRAAEGTEILHAIGGQITPPEEREDILIDKQQQLRKAVEAAEKSDVVILYIGTNSEIESEGDDRPILGLPGNQLELVQKVHSVNPNTVVVLINAGPMTIPWVKDNVPAIVEAWIAGEEGGNAMADIIFGNVNPGGKMPFTVYASEDQVPPQDEYDISEGFTYMYINGEPLFPFGHGLHYTEFEYNDLNMSPQQISADEEVTISVFVKNTGYRTGTEVIQVYSHDTESSVVQPAKELLDFHKIELNPGEEQEVSFVIPVERLSFYDVESDQFVVEPGNFDIMVGSSSGDIRETGSIEVVGDQL